MKRSEQINELAAALAKAAGNFPPIPRGCTARVRTKAGGEYSYDYADLDDVLRAVRPALSAQGLTLAHDSIVVNGGESLAVDTTAILMHSSGQFLESSPLRIPCDGTMAPAQLVGSATSYGRRYTTQSILGLSTETDEDGNAASGNDATISPRQRENLGPCPKCGKSDSVIVGKAEFGGGLVCFKKKQGCGHTWETDAHPLVKTDEPPKAQRAQSENKHYDALAKFLKNAGCQNSDEADAVLRSWACDKPIKLLKDDPGMCAALFKTMSESLKTGPELLSLAGIRREGAV